jgi:hypothetical protein
MDRALLILGFICLCGFVRYLLVKTSIQKLRLSSQFSSIALILVFFAICGMSFYWIKERQRTFLKNADDAITRQQSMLEYNIKQQK